MEQIGERIIWRYLPFTDIPIPLGGLNIITILSTLAVMAALWGLLWLGVRRFAWIPGRGQMMVEMFLGGFDSMVSGTLELKTRDANRHYLPLISSLFLFIVMSNAIPVLPIPHLEEPTCDLNCTLALGAMVVFYSVYCSVRAHGLKGHLAAMCGPMWHHEGKLTLGALPGKIVGLGFFFPLHIVEDVSRIMSISFRLFGNITGGAVILTVISVLSYGMVIPLGLNAFVYVFEAAVQAFVFSMLSLMYIASALQHE